MTMEPDIYNAAKAYAAEKKISFSRLVQETLCQALGLEGKLSEELRKKVEERITVAPGRKALSHEELVKSETRRLQIRDEVRDALAKARAAKLMERYPTIAEIEEREEAEE
jgi:uncharacterized protein YdcH (DUF465 family)